MNCRKSTFVGLLHIYSMRMHGTKVTIKDRRDICCSRKDRLRNFLVSSRMEWDKSFTLLYCSWLRKKTVECNTFVEEGVNSVRTSFCFLLILLLVHLPKNMSSSDDMFIPQQWVSSTFIVSSMQGPYLVVSVSCLSNRYHTIHIFS
jgi:hypothetical protein